MGRRVLRFFWAATFLLLTFVPAIRANNTSAANSQTAALQIAIWGTEAQSYLTSLYDAGSGIYTRSMASVLEVARGDRGQDRTAARVSESSTLLLVGVAFLMFAKRARRERRREI